MSFPKELEYLIVDINKNRKKEFFKYSNPDILLEINGQFKAFGKKAVYDQLLETFGKGINLDEKAETNLTKDGIYEIVCNGYSYSFIQLELKNSRYSYLNFIKN